MYSKPKVERFGTFRDLTRTGAFGGLDGPVVGFRVPSGDGGGGGGGGGEDPQDPPGRS